MRLLNLFVLSLAFALPGCTTIQRTAHMYSSEAPQPLSFQYQDGGSSTYYSFIVGDASQSDTVVFFYGATGCPSWKSVMPGYVSGLTVNAHVFVLNKRFVPDRSTGLFDCGHEFHLVNNPNQWVADYSEFIAAQTGSGSLNERLVAMEEHIRSLEEQMSTSAELIKALAEQNALLVRRFELNNTRLRRLAVATAIGGVVLLGSIAYLLFGT